MNRQQINCDAGRCDCGYRRVVTLCRSMRRLSYLLSLVLIMFSGCAIFKSDLDLPPLLAQDEVLRSYTKLADVKVSRERIGASYELKTEDYNWAYEALREEAAKIGADAVIFPEVKVEASSYLLFPAAHMDARGIAIRFR